MGSGIFSVGTTAMQASKAMLDTTSHNISNVNTPGYSRQQVQLETAGGLFTGAGYFGRGVNVVTVSRSTNEFLTRENNINVATSAADQTRLDKLTQLENVVPTGESGLGYAAQQVLNAFVDVASKPQDMSARQVVLARAQDFVSRANTAGKQIDELQSGVVSDMQTTVSSINTLTKQIATINQAIASAKGIGHEPNDLMDQRDQLLKQLNGLVQVNTVEADDGSLSVFLGGGQLLVLSNSAETLSVVRDPTDSTQSRVALKTNGTERILDSAQMTGGTLKGLLQFQDSDIASTRADLNTFVSQFAGALNQQQSLGVDATGALQTTFDSLGNPVGTPLFLNYTSATDISLNLTQPKGLAAASPLVATVLPTNTGTASISSLAMARAIPQSGALDAATSLPTTTTSLNVLFETSTTDPTQLTYRFVDSTGTPYKDVTPKRVWTAGSPINDADAASTPSSQLFNLQISGVPRAGDQITIARTAYPASNNGNAQAFLALRDKAMISLDGVSYATVTDAYSQMIGNLGVTVQGGKTAADISSNLAQSSEQTLSSNTGVNLDEEAARLIQYQQSYQAAAKVLQMAQSLFQTLLQTAGG